MTDTTIRINGHTYNVITYVAEDTGYWRAEAGYRGRVVEVVDTPREPEAWTAIRAKLETRCKRSR